MKRQIFALLIAISMAMSCSDGQPERMALLEAPVSSKVEIEPYHQQWMEIFHLVVSVKPDTEYILTGGARSTLKTLKQGAFIGARDQDGKTVIKDKEYLLYNDKMTPMSINFNSGSRTEIMLFCGAWVNQTVEITVNDFYLTESRRCR